MNPFWYCDYWTWDNLYMNKLWNWVLNWIRFDIVLRLQAGRLDLIAAHPLLSLCFFLFVIACTLGRFMTWTRDIMSKQYNFHSYKSINNKKKYNGAQVMNIIESNRLINWINLCDCLSIHHDIAVLKE